MTTTSKFPKIYVGTYAKYNNGDLSGQWVDLEEYPTEEEFYNYCKELHSDEEDPELMFQDYENDPGNFISESGIDSELWEYLEAIAEMDETEADAYSEYISMMGSFQSPEDFRDAYQGEYEDEEEFAEQLFDDCYLHEVPESIQYYIDYAKFARDLFMSDYTYQNGFVFRNI